MPFGGPDPNGHAVARANGVPPVLAADDCGAIRAGAAAGVLPFVLAEGEEVLRQSRAALLRRSEVQPTLGERLVYPLTAGLRSHPGVLSLTGKRLVFVPIRYEDQALALETHLHRLSAAGTSHAGLRATLTVDLVRGARYEFVVPAPDQWASAIASVAGLGQGPTQ